MVLINPSPLKKFPRPFLPLLIGTKKENTALEYFILLLLWPIFLFSHQNTISLANPTRLLALLVQSWWKRQPSLRQHFDNNLSGCVHSVDGKSRYIASRTLLLGKIVNSSSATRLSKVRDSPTEDEDMIGRFSIDEGLSGKGFALILFTRKGHTLNSWI